MRPSVLAIFGPTASGKSAVAEAVVDRIGGEVVSADSAQVYRELPILTNQPLVATRLVGIWELDHDASVAEYQRLAHAAVDEILARGSTPVVVGGTGLYLRAALSDLESLTLDRETHHYRETISPRYAELVYNGLWHSPLRASFDAFLESSHRWVSGSVRLKLFKGFCLAVSRTSPYSLYRHDLATFGEAGVYDQKDAAGFNNLWALPTRVVAAVRRETASAAPEPAPVTSE